MSWIPCSKSKNWKLDPYLHWRILVSAILRRAPYALVDTDHLVRSKEIPLTETKLTLSITEICLLGDSSVLPYRLLQSEFLSKNLENEFFKELFISYIKKEIEVRKRFEEKYYARYLS